MKKRTCLSMLSIMLVSLCGFLPCAGRAASVPADSVRVSSEVSAPIYFRQGRSDIDLAFMGNRERMESFVVSLRRVLDDPDYVVNKVSVVGMASPEGSRAVNEKLAGARAEALAAFVMRETGIDKEKVEVINGGENWAGLLAMIEESSEVPDKADLLSFWERYGNDRDALKRSLQYYNGSRAWRYMAENFFPILRTGAGGAFGGLRLSELSRGNWDRIREMIDDLGVDDKTREAMLSILATRAERPAEAQTMIDLLHAVYADEQAYADMRHEIVDNLLEEPNAVSDENWEFLRARIAASDIKDREEILRIIDDVAAACGREQKLRELNGGETYRQIERLFPGLLADTDVWAGTGSVNLASETSAENWRLLREMISISDMPEKAEVLAIIDGEPDFAVRERKLRELNGGSTYYYIKEVFFPELLYGLSPAARENWKLIEQSLADSDLENKEEVLRILKTMPAGSEREAALRALDNGRTWDKLREEAFSTLLLNTEPVEVQGAGISFSFEQSPEAKARVEAMRRRQVEERLAEERRREEEARLAAERERAEAERLRAEREAAAEAAAAARRLSATAFALKTDLVLWGSVMPGFEMGAYTPNLSGELYFARRWSIQVGGAYCNWTELSGSHGLYALTAVDVEPRIWFKKNVAYRGFYAGLYGTYGDFDIQPKERMTGTTGTYFMAGASIGYMPRLSAHWYLDVNVRLGYRSAKCEDYTAGQGYYAGHYYLDLAETRGKFAPQVRLQVVYRFGQSGK